MSRFGAYAAIAVAVGALTIAAIGVRGFSASHIASRRVIIENMKFTPAQIEIKLGERIEFLNTDLVVHTATGKAGEKFDSDVLRGGQTWAFTPTRAGTISYGCKFHPVMEGRIVVRIP